MPRLVSKAWTIRNPDKSRNNRTVNRSRSSIVVSFARNWGFKDERARRQTKITGGFTGKSRRISKLCMMAQGVPSCSTTEWESRFPQRSVSALSLVLFNIFLEKILWNTLQDLEISVFIGGKQLSNLRLANDIDLMAGINIELQSLTNRVAGYSKAYEMSISTQNSKVMVNIIICNRFGS